MRGLIQFVIFLAIVFFVVGEFLGGWYLGVIPQTPAYVYKKTHTASVKRQAIQADEFPFTVKGKLSKGSVTVEGVFERPTSIQNPGRKILPEKVHFTETFLAGQSILISEVLEEGPGLYRVRLRFEGATGSVNIEVPPSSSL